MATLNPGEADCYAVLLAARKHGTAAMRLSEVHRQLLKRREEHGEPAPALTTVSSALRSLLYKGIIEERDVRNPDPEGAAGIPSRGLLPATRSPNTGYSVSQEPGDVLSETYQAIARVYPEGERWKAVLDFAKATLNVSDRKLKELQELLQNAERRSR